MSDTVDQVKKAPGGWMCRRGIHLWLDRSDAEKCCHPAWKRILVIGGGTHQQICAGRAVGRKWVKTNAG